MQQHVVKSAIKLMHTLTTYNESVKNTVMFLSQTGIPQPGGTQCYGLSQRKESWIFISRQSADIDWWRFYPLTLTSLISSS